jgi:hypothetical protein
MIFDRIILAKHPELTLKRLVDRRNFFERLSFSCMSSTIDLPASLSAVMLSSGHANTHVHIQFLRFMRSLPMKVYLPKRSCLFTSARLMFMTLTICIPICLSISAHAQNKPSGFCPQNWAPVCCKVGSGKPDPRTITNEACCKVAGGTVLAKGECKDQPPGPPPTCLQVLTCFRTPYGHILSNDGCPPMYDYYDGKSWIRNVCNRGNDTPGGSGPCKPTSRGRCS